MNVPPSRPAPASRNVRKKPASVPPVEAQAVESEAKPKSRSRWAEAFRVFAGFVLVLVIGGSVAYGARRYVKTSPRFAITEVVVAGASRRSVGEISATGGITKGENVFSVDLEQARARLLTDPWISEAAISRRLPGTIAVQVTEREAAGILATVDATSNAAADTYLVARDGSVIKRIEAGDPTDFHVLTGLSVQELTADREGATRTVRRALDLASEYERSSLGQRSPLQEVHLLAGGEMTLIVGKSAVSLHMGEPPYKKKLDEAVRVLGELDRRGAKPDAIMLDDEARPERVVVRMR